MDFADLKASIPNTLQVGLMAIVVIVVLKWATVKVYIPGFSELIAAV
jgi:hypothetical protein